MKILEAEHQMEKGEARQMEKAKWRDIEVTKGHMDIILWGM